MRKRLIIGAIAVVVIGVATYVLSRPKEGTVEWYKREYVRAMGEAYGTKWYTPIENLYFRLLNKPRRSRILSREAIAHLKRGEEARLTLHRMGFLSVRRFTITNVLREEAAASIWKQRETKLSRDEELFVNFTYPTTDTNMLVIEGVAEKMAEWEAAVADVTQVRSK